MKAVNADLEKMNDFLIDIKRHKDDIISKNNNIIYKIQNLGSYWKDKAYEKYKEDFIKENNDIVKKQAEFFDQKIKILQLQIIELEEFLDKANKR